jgi:acetyltransferase-like isoleucine patch superfamily enzyme
VSVRAQRTGDSSPNPWLRTQRSNLRHLRRSKVRWYDARHLVRAELVRPRDHYLSGNVHADVRGRVETNGPFYFDVLCNRFAWAPGDKSRLSVAPDGVLKVGSNVRIAGGSRIFVDGELEIGDSVRINAGTLVLATTSVVIGAGTAIAPGCTIMDSDIHDLVGGTGPAPITIGERAWLGRGATVLKGVEVGNGSVVAAGSVVTRDVPPATLVAGAPARVVRHDVEWE